MERVLSTNVLEILCNAGTKYRGKKVICTVPLGVLQTQNKLASLQFYPSLSFQKQLLLKAQEVGNHNKVVFNFRETDIFWPTKVLQFNFLHSCVQFTNLHAVGKKGILLANIFGSDRGTLHVDEMTDKEVATAVLKFLHRAVIDAEGYGFRILSRTSFATRE